MRYQNWESESHRQSELHGGVCGWQLGPKTLRSSIVLCQRSTLHLLRLVAVSVSLLPLSGIHDLWTPVVEAPPEAIGVVRAVASRAAFRRPFWCM